MNDINIDQCNSVLLNVTYRVGVIQSLKLYLLHMNYICNISSILNVSQFADDTNMFCSRKELSKDY